MYWIQWKNNVKQIFDEQLKKDWKVFILFFWMILFENIEIISHS